MHILRVVHMLVGIEVMRQDRDGLAGLASFRRNPDLSGLVVHFHLGLRLIPGHKFRRDPHRVQLLHIQQGPHGIGHCEQLSFCCLHHEITHSQDALEIIGSRSGPHRFAHDGPSVKPDLPVIDDPRERVLFHIVQAHAQILRLEGGAILEIVDHLLHRQLPFAVDFAVADPSIKFVHCIPA